MNEKRPVGRPRKGPEKGPRQNYTFRMHDQTREFVFAAAEANGRSMSEEIEARIEASFAEDRMRAIVRDEMDKREAQNGATHFAQMIKILEAQGRLGPALNPVCPPGQRPRIYNEC